MLGRRSNGMLLRKKMRTAARIQSLKSYLATEARLKAHTTIAQQAEVRPQTSSEALPSNRTRLEEKRASHYEGRVT